MSNQDTGTYVCPICRKATPHQHSQTEITAHQTEVAQRNLRQWMVGETQYDGGRTFGQHYSPVKNADGKQVVLLTPTDARKVVEAHNTDLKLVAELSPDGKHHNVKLHGPNCDGVALLNEDGIPHPFATARLYENPSAVTLFFRTQLELETAMQHLKIEIGPPVSFGSAKTTA